MWVFLWDLKGINPWSWFQPWGPYPDVAGFLQPDQTIAKICPKDSQLMSGYSKQHMGEFQPMRISMSIEQLIEVHRTVEHTRIMCIEQLIEVFFQNQQTDLMLISLQAVAWKPLWLWRRHALFQASCWASFATSWTILRWKTTIGEKGSCSIPSGKLTNNYWTWPSRNRGFTHFHSMVDLSSSLCKRLPFRVSTMVDEKKTKPRQDVAAATSRYEFNSFHAIYIYTYNI